MLHHQAGIFARAVGVEVRIGHIYPHPLVLRNIGNRRVSQPARAEGVLNQRFGLSLTPDHFTNQADPLFQPLVIGLLFIGHRRVHFVFLTRGILAQRDCHHRDPGALDLLDHRLRRVVGNEHHLGMQRQQALDIDLRQIARHR